MPFVSDLQRKWFFSNLATGLFGSAGNHGDNNLPDNPQRCGVAL